MLVISPADTKSCYFTFPVYHVAIDAITMNTKVIDRIFIENYRFYNVEILTANLLFENLGVERKCNTMLL